MKGSSLGYMRGNRMAPMSIRGYNALGVSKLVFVQFYRHLADTQWSHVSALGRYHVGWVLTRFNHIKVMYHDGENIIPMIGFWHYRWHLDLNCCWIFMTTFSIWRVGVVADGLAPPGKNTPLTINIRRTLVGNKFADHSDVVGASPAALPQPHLHVWLNT